jgi:hypothetical protein
MKIVSVVSARPNFMKITPFIRAIKDYNTRLRRKHSPAKFHNLPLIAA